MKSFEPWPSPIIPEEEAKKNPPAETGKAAKRNEAVGIVTESSESGKYSQLKRGLLDGFISLEGVRDELLAMDQATPTHEAALGIIKFLKDSEVVEFIKQNPDSEKQYHKFLGFIEFHAGQSEAMQNSDKAISYFEDALAEAEVGGSEGSWISYIKGTLAYLHGEVIPDEVVNSTSSINKKILEKLNSGIKTRGFPSYSEDYA